MVFHEIAAKLMNEINVYFFRQGGEQSEAYFCETKSLSMPTLRMTGEAKVRDRSEFMTWGDGGFRGEGTNFRTENLGGVGTKISDQDLGGVGY